MDNEFTTVLTHHFANQLDECLSPMDGLTAIDQICLDLPRLHRSIRPSILRRWFGASRQVYHGRYGWYPLGFTYQQIRDELHILSLWPVREKGLLRRRKFDVVLDQDDDFTADTSVR